MSFHFKNCILVFLNVKELKVHLDTLPDVRVSRTEFMTTNQPEVFSIRKMPVSPPESIIHKSVGQSYTQSDLT